MCVCVSEPTHLVRFNSNRREGEGGQTQSGCVGASWDSQREKGERGGEEGLRMMTGTGQRRREKNRDGNRN